MMFVSDEIRAKMPQKPNCELQKIQILGENGINSKLKQRKAHNLILSGRFGDQYRRQGVGVISMRLLDNLGELACITGKNNGFPFLDILGYLKNTHKNPKFGKVRQVPTTEFPTKFPDWDLSHSYKFGIFVGVL